MLRTCKKHNKITTTTKQKAKEHWQQKTDDGKQTILPGDLILLKPFLPGYSYSVFQYREQPTVKLNYTAFPQIYFMI